MMEQIVGMLSNVEKGNITMIVNGKPLLSVDAASKSLGVEMSGITETGLKVGDLLGFEMKKGAIAGAGMIGKLREAEGVAKELNEKDWNLTLYSKGEKVLAMGRGVSRLTGHIHLNPSKAFELMGSL